MTVDEIKELIKVVNESGIAELQQEIQQLQARAQSKDDAILKEVNAAKDRELKWYEAETNRIAALQANAIAAAKVDQAAAAQLIGQMNNDAGREHDLVMQAVDQQHQAQMQDNQPKDGTDGE